MGKSRQIRDALIGFITPLEINDEPAFTEVVGHAATQFDGYPSVRVLPGDQTSEKAAYGQNDRTVSFVVRTHVPEATDGSDINALYDLTDLLMDELDAADFANQLPSTGISAFLLNSSRGGWGAEDSPTGIILTCDINVDITYSKDL